MRLRCSHSPFAHSSARPAGGQRSWHTRCSIWKVTTRLHHSQLRPLATRRHLPLARDLVRLSRQQLVHRLDSYMSKRNLPIFKVRSETNSIFLATISAGSGLNSAGDPANNCAIIYVIP